LENESRTLIEEAKSAYKMLLLGYPREIYFTENKNAILILECEDKWAAKRLLNELPFVRNRF
jgi:hypothetical protein